MVDAMIMKVYFFHPKAVIQLKSSFKKKKKKGILTQFISLEAWIMFDFFQTKF